MPGTLTKMKAKAAQSAADQLPDLAFHRYAERVDVDHSRLPPPVISWIRGCTWRLHEEYVYARDGHHITVPAGFEFDLASIPRQLWRLIAPFELSIAAPLIHDYHYRYQGNVGSSRPYTRQQADEVFREIMEWEQVPAWRRLAGYRAVRLFGAGAWRRAAFRDTL